MPSLWFVVPAHGRVELARICLRQLRRTCDLLERDGVDATAVVIADDENLDTARESELATYERDNQFLSKKFNDGIQMATDPAVNPRPADYVVPFGSDDWADHRLFLTLPPPDTMYGFQCASFVREDGRQITTRQISVQGGCGIRIYPRQVIAPLDYRPAEEDRYRACDTSIISRLVHHHDYTFKVEHRHLHNVQIVDWKSSTEQLNPYRSITVRHRGRSLGDPFEVLAEVYPAEALAEMREHYGRTHRDELFQCDLQGVSA